jgi:hypothetical protein
MDWFNVSGTFASLTGLVIVFFQIKQVKNVAQATKEASEKTRARITELIFVMEIPKAQRLVVEIQNYNRQKKFEISLLRMQDLRYHLLQIKNNVNFSEFIKLQDYVDFVTDISIEINNVEKVIEKAPKTFNMVRMNSTLDRILIHLSDLDIIIKTEGGKNDI